MKHIAICYAIFLSFIFSIMIVKCFQTNFKTVAEIHLRFDINWIKFKIYGIVILIHLHNFELFQYAEFFNYLIFKAIYRGLYKGKFWTNFFPKNYQIFEYFQKFLTCQLGEIVWDIKGKLLATLQEVCIFVNLLLVITLIFNINKMLHRNFPQSFFAFFDV